MCPLLEPLPALNKNFQMMGMAIFSDGALGPWYSREGNVWGKTQDINKKSYHWGTVGAQLRRPLLSVGHHAVRPSSLLC